MNDDQKRISEAVLRSCVGEKGEDVIFVLDVALSSSIASLYQQAGHPLSVAERMCRKTCDYIIDDLKRSRASGGKGRPN